MNVLETVEKEQFKDHPEFRPGDTVKVHVRIREGDKERIQIFEGVVIAQRHGGSRASFTVRKISYGVGVERVFPLHSSSIDKIEVVGSGKVRRAKLYYLRKLQGKAARLKARDRYGKAADKKNKTKAPVKSDVEPGAVADDEPVLAEEAASEASETEA